MVLDIIGASVLVAFGILAIYFSLNEVGKDKDLVLILAASIIAIAAGSWYLVTQLTLVIILTKLAALIIAAVGLFLVLGFPDVEDYQSFEMSKAGIFIGLIMLIAGVYILIFI